jgi:hypothetical protein
MKSLHKLSFIIFLCFGFSFIGQSQLYTNLGGEHHNQFFIGAGYSESFNNISYGFNHVRYFKRIKRDVVGILDFSSPLSHRYYTRFIFRKGFQVDLYRKNNFKLPISVITSSVKTHLSLFSFHDIITNITFLPGFYRKEYTFAAEASLKVEWFHRKKLSPEYFKQTDINPDLKHHYLNVSIGGVFAYNVKRFSFIGRAGFQQVSDWEVYKSPFYATGTIAFKLNFKKHAIEKSGPTMQEAPAKM